MGQTTAQLSSQNKYLHLKWPSALDQVSAFFKLSFFSSALMNQLTDNFFVALTAQGYTPQSWHEKQGDKHYPSEQLFLAFSPPENF